MNKPAKILVVEDQAEVAELLREVLAQVGHEVQVAHDGASAEALLKQGIPDLIILDIGLPDVNGFSLCHTWRTRPAMAKVAIIILTGLSSVPDRVTGLSLGADDYICKPFSCEELCARIEALLRRLRINDTPPQGPLTYRRASKELNVEGKVFHLTRTEDRLLNHLLDNAGSIMTAQELLRRAWSGRIGAGNPGLVRCYISRLRRYLNGSLIARQCLQTIGRDGYLLQPNSIQLIARWRAAAPATAAGAHAGFRQNVQID